MHKMMKTIIRRRKGSMANGNGNGNGGYSNGRNGSGVFAIAQLASTGVLILGMFGLWWQSADPKARLDKNFLSKPDFDSKSPISLCNIIFIPISSCDVFFFFCKTSSNR